MGLLLYIFGSVGGLLGILGATGLCSLPTLVGLAAVIAALFYYKYVIQLKQERAFFAKQGLPMTDFKFWVGDQKQTFALAKEGRQQDQDQVIADTLGSKTYMMSFGPINRINCLDVHVLRAIYITKQKKGEFHKSPMTASLLEPLLGMQGLFLMEGNHHLKYKKQIAPSVKGGPAMRGMYEVMVDTCKRQFPVWRQECADAIAEGKTGKDGHSKIEVHKAWNSLGLELIVGSVLGTDFKDRATHTLMYDTFNSLVKAILQRFLKLHSVIPGIRSLPMKSKKFVDAGVHRARSVVGEIIAKRKRGETKAISKNGYDLLDVLLHCHEVKDKKTGEYTPKPGATALNEAQLLDQVMTFVFAGHEPTSNLLTWVIWNLCENPDTLAKLKQEIDTELKGKPPTYDNCVKGLPYLEACLNESLRVHPPAPFIRRKCVKDTVIEYPDDEKGEACKSFPPGPAKTAHEAKFAKKKLTIPKGTEIYTNFYAIHHDPDYWPEPEVYDPDRFMNLETDDAETKQQKSDRKKFFFYPFGLGFRDCIGQSFALLESKVMLAMFLQNFDMEKVDGQQFKVDMKITMHPRFGVNCWTKPREVAPEYFEFDN